MEKTEMMKRYEADLKWATRENGEPCGVKEEA